MMGSKYQIRTGISTAFFLVNLEKLSFPVLQKIHRESIIILIYFWMNAMKKLILVGLILLSLIGCATSKEGDVYSRDQSQRVQTVEMGKIIDIRKVRIEGTKSGVGTVGGGVIGGIAGSTIGGGRGSAIASVVGAIAGGIAGSAIEEGTMRQDGIELTIELDNGKVIALVQAFEHDNEFLINDRVRVLHSGRESRVYRAGSE